MGTEASAGQGRDERRLLVRLHRPRAVVGTHPRHRVSRRMAAEHGQARQGSPSATVTAEATDLHPVTGTGAAQRATQDPQERSCIVGHAEVRPVHMLMRPGRLPSTVEIDPEIRRALSGVRVGLVEGHGDEFRTLGQDHDGPVTVQLMLAVTVLRVDALRDVGAHRPDDLAVDAHDDRADVGHASTVPRRQHPWSRCPNHQPAQHADVMSFGAAYRRTSVNVRCVFLYSERVRDIYSSYASCGATSKRCHVPGTPLSSCSPWSWKMKSEPARRSATVRETSTSPAPASDETR